MAKIKRYPNRLGVKGWLGGGKWGFERYLYTLHRVTGLAILLYFLMHILLTSSRAFSQEAWEAAMGAVDAPIFVIGEFLVLAAFAFHALNGLRLVLIELGYLTGKAEEPIYPYRSSLNVQRPFMIVMMILTGVLVVMGGYQYLFLGH